MIERDIVLILVGAGIGFVGSLVVAIVAHFLRLREDRIKRRRDYQDKETDRELAFRRGEGRR